MAGPSIVYSTRFIGGSDTNTSSLSYVVPTGYKAVVRAITIVNQGTGSPICSVVIPSVCFLANVPALAQYQTFTWTGDHVVNTGETISCTTAGAGPVYFMVSGFLLTLP